MINAIRALESIMRFLRGITGQAASVIDFNQLYTHQQPIGGKSRSYLQHSTHSNNVPAEHCDQRQSQRSAPVAGQKCNYARDNNNHRTGASTRRSAIIQRLVIRNAQSTQVHKNLISTYFHHRIQFSVEPAPPHAWYAYVISDCWRWLSVWCAVITYKVCSYNNNCTARILLCDVISLQVPWTEISASERGHHARVWLWHKSCVYLCV